MGVGLRVRVYWADDVVEDRVYVKRRRVRVGSGPSAHTVAPTPDGRVVTFTRRNGGYDLMVAPGVVRAIEFPGEEPIDGAAMVGPYARRIEPPITCGRLIFDGAIVEFESVPIAAQVGD